MFPNYETMYQQLNVIRTCNYNKHTYFLINLIRQLNARNLDYDDDRIPLRVINNRIWSVNFSSSFEYNFVQLRETPSSFS